MPRIASCQCEGFRAEVEGEPDWSLFCHCHDCQRRTGAHVASNAYFLKEKTRLHGEHRLYTRPAAQGRQIHNCFCPTCGTTVCWTLDLRPQHYGIAIGCFTDSDFPAPRVSLWEDRRLSWTLLPEAVERFARMRPQPQQAPASDRQ